MYRIQIVLALALLLTFVGCSSGKSPVAPTFAPEQRSQVTGSYSNRTVLGYWTVKIDPDSESVEIIPDREMASHFNVVRLLEVDPCTDCLKIENLSFLPGNTLQCDFELRHPFPGLDKFTGFDVRGVLVTDGDTFFPEDNRLASLDGTNPILLNPDGYTALFNPVEFPADEAPFPILGYIPGKFSYGDNFTATLNPFMAFAKDNPRRMLSAGATETVTVNLKYPSAPFEFGYIVDTSWTKVDNVTDPLTDFPPDANCLEPYEISCEVLSSITEIIGSSAPVQVEIFDHQGIDTISTISIECPSLFDGEVYLDYSSPSGDDSWLFDGVISNEIGAPIGSYPMLVRALSNESDFNLGDLTAFQIHNIFVQQHQNEGGKLNWAKRAGGIDEDHGHGITTLSDDSTVVTGEFVDAAIFGEGEVNETILTSISRSELFVARYNPNGTLAWAKQAVGMDNLCFNSCAGITALSDDSTVVTGLYEGLTIFGQDEPNETSLVTGGSDNDIFVARYNPDGTLAWAKRAHGWAGGKGRGITTLSDDSVVVIGTFKDSTTFGEGEANETVLVSDGLMDIFVARYNPDGSLAWAKRAGGTSNDDGFGIAALSDFSTVTTGIVRDSAIFGEGEANETILVSDGYADIFFACYNPDGTLAWAKRAGGTSDDRGRGITSLSDDSVVVTGPFGGSAIFGEGEANETVLVSHGLIDIFVARYNPDGTLVWVKQAAGTDSDLGDGITPLSDDSTVVTGYYTGSTTFGMGEANETVLNSAGDKDIFVARYYLDGTLGWAKSAGGDYQAFSWERETGSGITALSDDSTIVTGDFFEAVTFGKNEPYETVLVSDGDSDIFVARFAP